MACTITLQELHDFHSIDRLLFVRLVNSLRLDFDLAQQVVAFWYWLESQGYRYFIKVMLQLPNHWLYGLAMEAKSCLYCLAVAQSPEYCLDLDQKFPFMRSLVDEDFSIVELCKHAVKGQDFIEGYLKNLFGRVFNDLTRINCLPDGFQGQPVLVNGFPVQSCVASNVGVPTVFGGVEVPAMMANAVDAQSLLTHAVQPQPIAIMDNGVQALPLVASGMHIQDTVTNGAQVTRPKVETLTANEARVPCLATIGAQVPDFLPNGGQVPSVMANGIQGPTVVANGVQDSHNARNSGKDENGTHVVATRIQNLISVSEHDRTLFCTFSKGHSSISKAELRDLITGNYGDCVEYIHMRVDPPPLFALVVVKSAAALTKILGGKELVKLSSKRKHVWLRRFLPKQDDNHI